MAWMEIYITVWLYSPSVIIANNQTCSNGINIDRNKLYLASYILDLQILPRSTEYEI